MRDRKHGAREGRRRFLRQVVTDAAADQAMLVGASEARAIRSWFGVRRPVGVTFHSDRRHRDRWRRCKHCFGCIVSRLAFHETQTPAIIVNHDCDMVGVVEAFRRALLDAIVEMPFG